MRNQIGDLVLRVQDEFLETPGLALTEAEAQRRFGLDDAQCGAIFGVLADAHVIARMRNGSYIRFFPLGKRQTSRRAA